MTSDAPVGIVVIGRNEGERFRNCLRSLPANARCVYVDSGSTDGSVAFARQSGVAVVELDRTTGFTAARARNAGLAHLMAAHPDTEFIQMIDGDCELDSAWIGRAREALASEPGLAVVFGRRRERYPERSLYNRLCDDEWNVPVGIVESCGGDALFRAKAIGAAGGYSDDLIAGEEPDLCLRLRQAGWAIRRIDAEMTLHDAAITRFSQWWKRARRSGHAYAEHCWRNGAGAIPSWRRQLSSIAFWAGVMPLMLVLAALAVLGGRLPWLIFAVPASLYPIQFVRIVRRKRCSGADYSYALGYAGLILLGKFAEMRGVMGFLSGRVLGRRARLIEYKVPES